MFTWSPYPFLRILAVFIFGILAAKLGYVDFIAHHYLLCALVFLVPILFIVKFSKLDNKQVISGNIGLVIILIVGILKFWDYSETTHSDHIIHQDLGIDGYTAKVNSSCVEKEKYFIYEIDLVNIIRNDSIIYKKGKIHLYVRKGGSSNWPLNYGDEIVLNQSPFRLPPPKNPHEFNYMEYMAGRNIFYQQFVDIEDIKVIRNDPEWITMRLALDLRRQFAKIIENNVEGEQETAIAKALILGIRDGLDNQVKRSFSAAGAMHVLAVSGLHVGIIIGIISFLLKPIAKRRKGEIVSAIVSLTCLWLYAMVAGLSPSILRATTMFSVMVIGKAISTRQSIYNSLALSAGVLLFYNPNYLFSVGFQLSYIAVLGIVYIYPIIHRKLTFGNIILEYMWSFTCLSIAAQLATFPLSLFYFHQFPVYFLISNLIVIPAAMLIMGLGVSLILLGATPLASFIGAALKWIIYGLNLVVSFIEQLDFSLIDWLYLSPSQTLLIYLMIVVMLAFMHYKSFKLIYFMIVLAILVSTVSIYSIHNQSKIRSLVFYEIGGESVFDSIDGLYARLIRVNPIDNQELVKFQVEPNRLNSHLMKINIDPKIGPMVPSRYDGISYYYWAGKRFVFLNKPIMNMPMRKKIQADYLVISNNSIVDIDFLVSNFNFKEMIVDSSNDYRTCKIYERGSRKLNVKCRILRNEGALTIAF